MNKLEITPLQQLILLLVGVVFATAPAISHGTNGDLDGDDSQRRSDLRPIVYPGVVLIQVKEGTTVQTGASKTGVSSLDQIGRAYGVTEIERTFPFLDAVAARKRLSTTTRSLRRIYTIHFDAAAPPSKVASIYKKDPRITVAEPRYIRHTADLPAAADPASIKQQTGGKLLLPADPQAVPNDSLYPEMTHLRQIRMPDAWDITMGQNGDVVVAVVDGGTDWRHPDLRANVWTNQDEIENNGIDDDNNGFVDDVHGWNFGSDEPDPTGTNSQNTLHGTAVAGVVSAVANNEIGIAGSSWNATFMPLATGCENPAFDRNICYGLQGVTYAAANGADIINASWSGVTFSEIERQVIDAAQEQGALVVAASGNAGVNVDRSPTFPANARGVLSVGATQKSSDRLTEFSNYGESVDVFAPGDSINTTVPSDEGGYEPFAGTSFSAPLVSGIAALVKTNFPDYSMEEVREQVRVASEQIDDENAGYNSFLGQGRVNALRALTVTGIPSVRVAETAMLDADSDSLAESGETVELVVALENFLADANSVTAELVPQDTLVTITSGSVSLGQLARGATEEITFTFEVAEDAPQGRQVVFFVEITADDQHTTDVIRVVVNPAQAIEHTTDPLEVSITNEGNIGFVTFADESDGVGFRLNGRNLLFEGGLLVGTGPSRVSDCIRGDDPNVRQEHDFIPEPGAQLEIISPGEFTTEEGLITLVDGGAETPIGISVRQETYVDESDPYEEFIVFRYIVTNQDSVEKTDLHAGIFLDWDIDQNDPSTDRARFDQNRRLGYVFDNLTPSALGGLKLLTTDGEMSYRAIDNPEEIYQQTAGGFSSQEKWNFMSGGTDQPTELVRTDVSQLMASGPYSLDPGASAEIAFAVVGGETESNLLENADNAQMLWDETLSEISVDTEEPAPAAPTAFSLKTIYPNPTASSATFTYQIAQPGRVTLNVYDLLGRRVRTLVADRRPSGSYEITWNGLNELGHRVANGLYLVRLTVSTGDQQFSQSRNLMLVR